MAGPICPGSTLNGTYFPLMPTRFKTVVKISGDFDRKARSSPRMQKIFMSGHACMAFGLTVAELERFLFYSTSRLTLSEISFAEAGFGR